MEYNEYGIWIWDDILWLWPTWYKKHFPHILKTKYKCEKGTKRIRKKSHCSNPRRNILMWKSCNSTRFILNFAKLWLNFFHVSMFANSLACPLVQNVSDLGDSIRWKRKLSPKTFGSSIDKQIGKRNFANVKISWPSAATFCSCLLLFWAENYRISKSA